MAVKCPKCHFDNPDDTIYCGKCATSLKPPTELSVTKTLEAPIQELSLGTTFAGRYEIIEELGHGGMGRVYNLKDHTWVEQQRKIYDEIQAMSSQPDYWTSAQKQANEIDEFIAGFNKGAGL